MEKRGHEPFVLFFKRKTTLSGKERHQKSKKKTGLSWSLRGINQADWLIWLSFFSVPPVSLDQKRKLCNLFCLRSLEKSLKSLLFGKSCELETQQLLLFAFHYILSPPIRFQGLIPNVSASLSCPTICKRRRDSSSAVRIRVFLHTRTT